MKLEIVTGECLRPRRLTRPRMETIANAIHPGAKVPHLVWASVDDDPYYDAFFFADPSETEARTALALEYFVDAYASDDVLCLPLPVEPGAALDTFVDRGRAVLGPDSVSCVRWSLSANSDAVMIALGRTDPSSSRSIYLDDLDVPEDVQLALLSNYTRAILRLGHARVREATIFGGGPRAELVADHLERNHLLVRPDVPPAKILSELAPGGSLFTVLSGPITEMPR
jgi:hypothetical protein